MLPQRPKKALVPVSLSGLSPDHHDPDADADGDMDAEAEVEEDAWVQCKIVSSQELNKVMNSFLLVWGFFFYAFVYKQKLFFSLQATRPSFKLLLKLRHLLVPKTDLNDLILHDVGENWLLPS